MSKRNTDWDIRIYPKDSVLALEVSVKGEIPDSKAWSELLMFFGKWTEKHCSKDLRVFKFPEYLVI